MSSNKNTGICKLGKSAGILCFNGFNVKITTTYKDLKFEAFHKYMKSGANKIVDCITILV